MPRIRALVASWLAVAAVAAAAQPGDALDILYVDADAPAVKGSIRKFEAALERRGITARHPVTVRHVAVDVFDRERAARLIAAALGERTALIIATSSESAGIARGVTSRTPIVFGSYQDPVRLGLASSLAHPGANLTGFTMFVPIDLKCLELLREIAPGARRLGIVVDHWWMRETDGASILRAAHDELGFDARVFQMERPADLRLLQTDEARSMDAWYVPPTTLPFEHAEAMVKAIAALRRPAVFPNARYVEAGALAAYQPEYTLDEALDHFARIAGLVLDGVPPGAIPIERPKSFELVVNVSEARRLGIALPEALLKRADRVIGAASSVAVR